MKTIHIYRSTWLILMTILISVGINSCTTTQTAIDTKDLSYLYNPTKNQINPNFIITNISPDRSELGVRFLAADLFFSEANPEGIPKAAMMITVKLFNSTQGSVLSDTAFMDLSITKVEGKQEYIYKIPLRVKPGIEYVAEVKILDRIRSFISQTFVPFNTLSLTNSYNFRALGHFDKNELFNPVLRVNEYVNIVYLKEPVDSIYISFYKPFLQIPDPPSMQLPLKTIDYGPDTIVALPYSDALPMMFPKEGIYLCSVGRDINEGFSFYNFGASFPQMNTPEVMIEPLAYLATPDEMRAMRSAIRPKVELDDFWIRCGGNVERARELIRIYFTRVNYANYYFTSYREGWRTERGMIYLIYGPPDKVYKASDGESWGYRKPVLKSSWGYRYKVKEEYLFFTFKKNSNIFTDNDYYLSRSETLVTNWEQAVASWRKGIVYRLDNPDEI